VVQAHGDGGCDRHGSSGCGGGRRSH
jgi:hypothetical protein